MSETAGTPLLERGVVSGIVHEVILKAVPALRAIKDGTRSVERIDRSAWNQSLKIWIINPGRNEQILREKQGHRNGTLLF